MAKILTDKELMGIIIRTIDGKLIDDADNYSEFLLGLGELVCDHFGGVCASVWGPNHVDSLGWTVSFYPNECLPGDGGIFKDYDKDVEWKDGEEL